jgi:hypothetical protein
MRLEESAEQRRPHDPIRRMTWGFAGLQSPLDASIGQSGKAAASRAGFRRGPPRRRKEDAVSTLEWRSRRSAVVAPGRLYFERGAASVMEGRLLPMAEGWDLIQAAEGRDPSRRRRSMPAAGTRNPFSSGRGILLPRNQTFIPLETRRPPFSAGRPTSQTPGRSRALRNTPAQLRPVDASRG